MVWNSADCWRFVHRRDCWWLSGKIMEGRGFGLIGNIIVGIVYAFLAGMIFPALGFSVDGDCFPRDCRHSVSPDPDWTDR